MYRSFKTVHDTWWSQGVLILIYTCNIFIYCVSGYLSCHIHHCIFCIHMCVCVCVLCLTFCGPLECTPPGSLIHGILQARIVFPALQANSLPAEPLGKPTRMHIYTRNLGMLFSLYVDTYSIHTHMQVDV